MYTYIHIYIFRSSFYSKLNMLSTKGREGFCVDLQFKHPALHLVIRLCVYNKVCCCIFAHKTMKEILRHSV